VADFIRIPGNPAPEGAETFDFFADDGVRLRAAAFAAPDARAGVVLLNGRSEFIEKYFEVVGDLQARRFSVATMDWRGQGRSARLLADSKKGHIDDFAAYRADLRRFVDEVARPRLPGPLVLLTHSMGGAPALQLLADGYDAFAAAVLCAPMTRLFAGPLKLAYARAAARVMSALGAAGRSIPGTKEHSMDFDGNVLTSDPRRHARFRDLQTAAPDAVIREPTFGWLKAATDAMADLRRPGRFARMSTPTRIISAERDALVDSADHGRLAAASEMIDRVTVEGALHEILMEEDRCRAAFWAAFDDFVAPRLAGRMPKTRRADPAAPRAGLI
jgi:lysophospholipase